MLVFRKVARSCSLTKKLLKILKVAKTSPSRIWKGLTEIATFWNRYLLQDTFTSAIYKCSYLFSDSKTMVTLVNYTCKSFIKLAPDKFRAPSKRSQNKIETGLIERRSYLYFCFKEWSICHIYDKILFLTSLRSRRLEVVGTRKNGRVCAHYLLLSSVCYAGYFLKNARSPVGFIRRHHELEHG